MPAPAITCGLVAAVLLAQANHLAGVVLALALGLVEFLLPAVTSDEAVRDYVTRD